MNILNKMPTHNQDHSRSWYVVWAEARAEKKVVERLAGRGFSEWWPTVKEKRRWSDRWKLVTAPVFPGYLFVCTLGSGYVPLLRTLGVLTLVKEWGQLAVLDDGYITRLRTVVNDPKAGVEPVPAAYHLHPGNDGPLAGLRGVVTELRVTRRLLVWVHSVGRGLMCTLGAAAVVPAQGAP